VDNNYLDLGTNKSGFVHTVPVAGLVEGQHTLVERAASWFGWPDVSGCRVTVGRGFRFLLEALDS
jgi:hypothetical protein